MPSFRLNSAIWPFWAILIVIVVSIPTLTTNPHLWVDEAKSIELARNFSNYGKLNIQTAPNEFTEFPQILQSTGYPVTMPLALIFKVFGYGLAQARLYMLFWMAIFLIASFIFLRKLFGDGEAVLALFLAISFASFYDSGRTVVGEIPGFVFLILGLYFWLSRDSYYLSGLWFGLAVVTKPSVFGLIIPVIALLFLLERETGFLKKIFKIGVGMVPAAVAWIFLVLDKPFSKAVWMSIISLYRNPYGEGSIWQNVINNLLNARYSSTLIYFGLLFLVIILARKFIDSRKIKYFFNFVIIYSVLAFIYYLRSPGWLRYILIADFLILFSLFPSFSLLISRIKTFIPGLKLSSRWLSAGLVILLIAVQFVHFFTAAQIFYSDTAIKVSGFLNKEFTNETIGLINSLDVSVLLDTEKRFQIIEMTGIPIMGKNPLSLEALPEIIVFSAGEKLSDAEKTVLENEYAVYSRINEYFIYKILGKKS